MNEKDYQEHLKKHPNLTTTGKSLSSERAKEIGRKGGQAYAKNLRIKRALKALLDQVPSKELIDEFKKQNPNATLEKITNADLMGYAQMKQAIGNFKDVKGDVSSFIAIADRVEGKPKQQIDNTSSDGTMAPTVHVNMAGKTAKLVSKK